MARRGRRKKITYDSRESKMIYGILAILVSLLFFMSYFVQDTQVFEWITTLFGESRIFIGLFLFNLGLYFMNKDWAMSRMHSLVGQFFFSISLAIFLSTLIKQWDAPKNAELGQNGGLIGYTIRSQLEPLIGLNATQIFTVIIMAVSIPPSFSMSLTEFFNFIDRVFTTIMNWIKDSIPTQEELKKAMPVEPKEQPVENERTATFGDFRQNDQSQNEDIDDDTDDEEVEDKSIKQPKVHVSEVSSGEGAIVNHELQFPDWKLPPVDLLNDFEKFSPPQEDIKKNADIIEQTLQSFGVKAHVVDVLIGPSVTQYALDIALGTKVSKIQNLSNDLALALAVSSNSIRIEAPIPGTSYVGIEIPNETRRYINFKEIVVSNKFKSNPEALPVVVGMDINGDPVVSNIQKMPHLLIAGATGSGKSVVTNTFIMSLLMKKTPDEVRMIMVDPKQVELSDYNGIPHLLTPVITDMNKVVNALKWAVAEMESRYTIFNESKVRNIEGYNQLMGFAAIPYIVVIIDEMADMMMTGGAEIEGAIVRLAQKARATGIHLILATQRPSVDVITGILKANIPGRIGLSVATQVDSRVILDQIGAEALLGKGDLLLKEPDKNKPFRIQGVWTSPEEIQRVAKFIKEQVPEVQYTKEVVQGVPDPNLPEGAQVSAKFSDDELFADAVRVVVQSGKGSSSLIQRKLSIGYNRAARLLDELHKYGVVGGEKGSKPRDVLVSDAESFLAGGNSSDED